MPEHRLPARSALAGMLRPGLHGRAGRPGVVLQERGGLDIVTVAARRRQTAELARIVRDTYGLDLPDTPRWVGDARLAFLWAGDARWTALSEGQAGDLETTLRAGLGGLAAITGQGDGRLVLRLGGPSVRDLLAKAVAIDLHPRTFGPGDVAITAAFHIGVHIRQCDAEPSYDLSVARSYAGTLYGWLVAAAEEYGIEVLEPT